MHNAHLRTLASFCHIMIGKPNMKLQGHLKQLMKRSTHDVLKTIYICQYLLHNCNGTERMFFWNICKVRCSVTQIPFCLISFKFILFIYIPNFSFSQSTQKYIIIQMIIILKSFKQNIQNTNNVYKKQSTLHKNSLRIPFECLKEYKNQLILHYLHQSYNV